MNPIGKLRNMTSVYLTYKDRILLLFRQGSRVVNNKWIGSAGGHFEPEELNNAIVLIYCDELPDILLEWVDEAIKQLCKRRSKIPTRKSKRRIIILRPRNEEIYSTQREDHKLYWDDLLNNNLDNFY